jgi:hypothetical protein
MRGWGRSCLGALIIACTTEPTCVAIERTTLMPLIPAPPAAPSKDTLPLRIDQELHIQLREYAEFLGSTKEYIVSAALRRVFRHDKDFLAWQQARRASAPPYTSAVKRVAAKDTTPVESGASSETARRATSKERA